MSAVLPQRTRVYLCHHLDSTRWDDVVITTSLKGAWASLGSTCASPHTGGGWSGATVVVVAV
jgi:hypothetical protein